MAEKQQKPKGKRDTKVKGPGRGGQRRGRRAERDKSGEKERGKKK